MSCRSHKVSIPTDAVRHCSISVSRILHHRPASLCFFEVHKLGTGVRLGAPSHRQQIQKEGQDVESKDERNDPFEDGRHVLLTVKGRGGEDGCEDDLDKDEAKLEPEGEAQNPVIAEVHAEALVLGADEDSADDVSRDKEKEEAIV